MTSKFENIRYNTWLSESQHDIEYLVQGVVIYNTLFLARKIYLDLNVSNSLLSPLEHVCFKLVDIVRSNYLTLLGARNE